MLPSRTHSRINLIELKAQMVKKLGLEKSKQYFYHLNKFLSLKLIKIEFNKLCLRILGRENIPLHNQLIRSILRNACTSETPPPTPRKDEVPRHVTLVSGKEISANGDLSNGSHNICSPQKARSNFRDLRIGRNAKTSFVPQVSKEAQSNDFNVILQNGVLNRLEQQAKSDSYILVGPTPEFPVMKSPNDSNLQCSRVKNKPLVRNGAKEDSETSPLKAPLGLRFCPVSIGEAPGALPLASISASNDGFLLDSFTLRERMEQIASAQALEGVSVDCANLLNNSLDSYMKRLIRSCVELVGITSGNNTMNTNSSKLQIYAKLVNGVIPNTGLHLEGQDRKIQCPDSLQDFRVAMEINPQQLGEDWPLLLEKISLRAFEE